MSVASDKRFKTQKHCLTFPTPHPRLGKKKRKKKKSAGIIWVRNTRTVKLLTGATRAFSKEAKSRLSGNND